MAPLATAFVRLRPDSSLLAAEATRDASRAGDRAGAAMGRSMSSGLSRTFKAAAGIGAATGLVEAGRKVLELADKFEAARASAEQNTENIGVAFASIEKPIGSLDDKMAALGFTITDTEGSFSQLVTATRDPAKAMRDVALAADIARGRHISLNEATQILMRVETGHVAMLGRLGIATRNANGSIFTQQEAIEALGRAYGGNASRFADTFAGKQAVARAEIQKSATEIGVALLPALVDLANVVSRDVLPPIVDVAHWLDQHKRTIEPLVGAVVKLTLAWKAYNIAIKLAAGLSKTFAGVRVAEAGAGAFAGRAVTSAAPVPVFVTNWMEMAGASGLLSRGGAAASMATGTAAASEGTVIGESMAGGLNTSFLNLATKAGLVAGQIGTMGLAALGFANFFSNPRSLGFPMGFNNDIGPGDVHKGQHIKLPNGQSATVTGSQTTYFDKQGRAYSDPGLTKLVTNENAATLATKVLSAAQTALGGAVTRTAAQIETAAQKHLDLTGAQDALREAFHQAAQTAADNGRALSGNSDAALANRDAIRQEANAIFAVIDAMKAHGASAAAQASELQILERALEINATKTYGDKAAVDALLRSLGLIPDAVSAAATALAALNPVQQALLNSDTPSKGAIQQLNAGVAKAKAQAATTGKQVADSFVAGYSPIVAKGTENAAKKAADKAAAAFKAAKDKMLSDVDTIRQAIAGTQQQIAAFADFAVQGTDALGASGLNTDVTGQLKAKAAKLQTFARLFTQLDRMHLDPHLMAQFAQIGPDAIPAMQALIHQGPKGIGAVNRIESRIQGFGAQVGRIEAKDEYGPLIHKDLRDLPAKLEKPFANALRHLHLSVSLKESDWKQGKGVLVSP